MNGPFAEFLQHYQQHCENAISGLIDSSTTNDTEAAAELALLRDAAQYSVTNGGKRIRPVLAYAAALAVEPGYSAADLDPCVTAIELIHTYSLVHDDLPAMDDDDLRRGKPSLHKAYDEATAILVGDGLQARAFELLADAGAFSAQQKVAMIKSLAAAAGPRGMVGGQFVDIRATGTDIGLTTLRAMHTLKTGALIRCSLALGGIATGATRQQLAALDDFGRDIGLAFQVVDDILDVEGDTATLGKTRGKDGAANKATYVNLMGLENAREEAQQLLNTALAALEGFGVAAERLRELARYIVLRDR